MSFLPSPVYSAPTVAIWDNNGSNTNTYPVVVAINNDTTSTAANIPISNGAFTNIVNSTGSFTWVTGATYRATVPVGGIINSASGNTGISFKILPPGGSLSSGSPAWIEGGITASVSNQTFGGTFVDNFVAVSNAGPVSLVAATGTAGVTAVVSGLINTTTEPLIIERLA